MPSQRGGELAVGIGRRLIRSPSPETRVIQEGSMQLHQHPGGSPSPQHGAGDRPASGSIRSVATPWPVSTFTTRISAPVAPLWHGDHAELPSAGRRAYSPSGPVISDSHGSTGPLPDPRDFPPPACKDSPTRLGALAHQIDHRAGDRWSADHAPRRSLRGGGKVDLHGDDCAGQQRQATHPGRAPCCPRGGHTDRAPLASASNVKKPS